MKLRSLLACILTLALVMSMGTGLAATTVSDVITLEAREVTLNRASNTLAIRGKDANYYLICDTMGNPLSNTQYIKCSPKNSFFEVAVQSGLNTIGLVDGVGNEVMPMAYGDVIYVSEKWQLGILLTNATADNYDYRGFGGDNFYLIDRIDVYFEGEKVGELSRLDYQYVEAYGDYLKVTTKERVYKHFDKNMNLNSEGSDYYKEYYYNGRTKTNIHLGSGQEAFAAGCTLMPDEVHDSVYYNNGQFIDLQGNVLRDMEDPYEIVYTFYGDYAKVKKNGKFGLVYKDGTEVLPCEYDAIDSYNKYFDYGYQMVVKDGKAGFVNLQGEVTCDFKYAATALKRTSLSPLASLTDLEGNVVVLSAAAGVLPETYKEVSINVGCPVFAALNYEEQAAVIDLYGNAVVPFGKIYDSTYDFTISNDGTVVVGSQGYYTYEIFNLTFDETEVAENVAGAEAAEAPVETTKSGEWNCGTCGTANSGKFCTECGAAKPAAAPKCTNCGYEPEGNAPKFCPECGTKF